MAGELGFEPRSSVLETDSLTVELTPPYRDALRSRGSRRWCLLRLFVVRVLAAGIAELRELQATGGRLLVLRGRVVPVLTSRTLQSDNFAHWCESSLVWPATSAGKQQSQQSRYPD